MLLLKGHCFTDTFNKHTYSRLTGEWPICWVQPLISITCVHTCTQRERQPGCPEVIYGLIVSVCVRDRVFVQRRQVIEIKVLHLFFPPSWICHLQHLWKQLESGKWVVSAVGLTTLTQQQQFQDKGANSWLSDNTLSRAHIVLKTQMWNSKLKETSFKYGFFKY